MDSHGDNSNIISTTFKLLITGWCTRYFSAEFVVGKQVLAGVVTLFAVAVAVDEARSQAHCQLLKSGFHCDALHPCRPFFQQTCP